MKKSLNQLPKLEKLVLRFCQIVTSNIFHLCTNCSLKFKGEYESKLIPLFQIGILFMPSKRKIIKIIYFKIKLVSLVIKQTEGQTGYCSNCERSRHPKFIFLNEVIGNIFVLYILLYYVLSCSILNFSVFVKL